MPAVEPKLTIYEDHEARRRAAIANPTTVGASRGDMCPHLGTTVILASGISFAISFVAAIGVTPSFLPTTRITWIAAPHPVRGLS